METIFKSINVKYQKYWMLNEENLAKLKHESFKEDNYDQIENFNEYERFLGNSYFNKLVNLLNKMFDLMKMGANSIENTKDFFSGSVDLFLQEYNTLDIQQTTRT